MSPNDGAPRRRVESGSPYEERFGFCRAIRVGERVLVAGTAPIRPDGEVDAGAGAQAERCFEIVAQALDGLGSGLGDVVRTRMYILDRVDSDAVGAAHRRAFGTHRPVATMVVVAGLLDPRWRVEVEAEAITAEAMSPAEG